MADWSAYSLEDFLLFSPRVYRRMFVLHNEALWPLPLLGLLFGALILASAARRPPWAARAISAVLGLVWIWVAWSFFWTRYASINWAAAYIAPAFALQGVMLIFLGGALRLEARRVGPHAVGLAILLYAVLLHPLLGTLAARPLVGAEIFGIAPDPTVIATLGILAMTSGGMVAWLLLAVPLLWCGASALTLVAMGAPEAWLPLAAAGLATASLLWSQWSNRAAGTT